MKVALIQCPAWGTYDPPLALAQLSSCLKKAGHKIFVLDMNIKLYRNRQDNHKNMWAWEQSQFWYDLTSVKKFFNGNSKTIEGYLSEIIEKNIDIIGFSISASSRLASLETAKLIKKMNPKVLTVFGGPLFLERRFIDLVLEDSSVDIVIIGESEITLNELLEFVEEKKDISTCKGMALKRENKIVVTEPRQPISDLDVLPFLDFSKLPLTDYDDSRHIPIMSSRGCVLNCVFCSSRSFWSGYRTMSGQRIFKEIEFQKAHLGKLYPHLGHVDFMDLVFNGNLKTLEEFCEFMIKAEFKIAWTANMIIRQDMTSDILKKIKEAGCEHILFGIESGSPRILKLMRKNYRIEDADRIIKELHELGIIVTCNFMFGFPGEREEDFQLTLDFIRRNAKYLDRVYPSRTFCAIEEFSYLPSHLNEFNIKPNPPNHLYWESVDGKNTYPERLRRCEEFCALASSLGIEVGCGVQISVKLDEWFNLGYYYEHKGDFEKAIDCFLNYFKLDANNEAVSNKLAYYSKKIDTISISDSLKATLRDFHKDSKPEICQSPELSPNANGKKRFTWNIHYDCNYRCPYCFFEGKWEDYRTKNVYIKVEEWFEYWRRIYKNYGCCFILITGGEPFIYPNFIELIEELSHIHYPINISTNASGDLDSFVRRIDSDRVSLSVSFQPGFEKIDSFLEKVKFLRTYNFNGCINFVAYPPFIKDISFYKEKFNSIGQELKVIPFWGKYEEKEYPLAYTEEEKELIGINGEWFNRVRKKGSICPAGYNSALVFPDGKVARCGQIGERRLIGSLFDNNFKLLHEKLPCDAEFCPCDEDRLFGEEEKEHITISNNKNDPEVTNPLLNDREYELGKTVLASSPKAIFIQVAGPCNSFCAFCSRGKDYEIFDLRIHRQRFEKTLYPFIKKAERLFLTGSGEFLQLPDADKILDSFDENFPQVEKCFSTNGSSLIPWVCDKIVNSKSRYTIHISLHASNAALHRAITRTDNFHKILGQIKYLVDLRKDKDKTKVHLIFVATTLNIEDLPNFVRLAANLKVDKVICYYNYIYTPAQKYLSCFFKQGFTNEILDEAVTLTHRLNMDITLPPKFAQKDYPNVGPCREAWSQIMFDINGHVLPCDASEDCDEILGDGKDFMDIWNSSYYQNLRKLLLDGTSSCFSHCFRANPKSVNDFKSHVIHRGKSEDITEIWGDNF